MNTQQLLLAFEESKAQLKSYVFRITASQADAEDIIQDTFIRASEKIDSFKGDSSIKTWLFTIASNIAKDNLRARKRWVENVTDICKAKALANPEYFPEVMHINATSPQGQFEIKEHIVFCFTCISKSLPLEQQLCIFLKEIYEFKIAEISEILSLTEALVKYFLHAGRQKMIDIYDGRCALINKEGACHQCSELNGIFNPKQESQHEIMKIQMAREAEKGDKERLFDLRMEIMRNSDPFNSNSAALQLHHFEHNRRIMENF